MERQLVRNLHFASLVVAITLLALLVFPGLTGPFQLDDNVNLGPVEDFKAGDIPFWTLVFENQSGPLGRPLSMLSFALQAHWLEWSPSAARIGNLALHGLIAMVWWRILLQLLPLLGLSPTLSRNGAWLLSLWWLVLPIHVSTYLYPVQRMAQLSTLGVLLSMLLYLRLRGMATAPLWRLRLGYWLVLPLLIAMAAFSKEDGLLALPLLFLIEMATRVCRDEQARRVGLKWFFALAVGGPFVAMIGLLLFRPDFLLGGYATRDFTLVERVLTEGRVLWTYVRQILLPQPIALGIVHDGYLLSRSLVMPLSTLFAWIGWLVLGAMALRGLARQEMRLPAFGLGLFLIAHAMESSFLPLEIYFEHRNYLASMGILLIAASLTLWVANQVRLTRPRQIVTLLACAVLGLNLMIVHLESYMWSDPRASRLRALENQPDSMRAVADLMVFDMHAGDEQLALHWLEYAIERHPSRTTALRLGLEATRCRAGLQSTDWTWMLLDDPGPISLSLVNAFENLINQIKHRQCEGMQPTILAVLGTRVLAQTSLPDHHAWVWRVRYFTAVAHAEAGQWDESIQHGKRAFEDSGGHTVVAILLFQVANAADDRALALTMFEYLRQGGDGGRKALREALGTFGEYMERAGADALIPDAD